MKVTERDERKTADLATLEPGTLCWPRDNVSTGPCVVVEGCTTRKTVKEMVALRSGRSFTMKDGESPWPVYVLDGELTYCYVKTT